MAQRDNRINERGSMITFVVVGLVLAALVVGGIYAVQNRNEKPSPSTPVVVTTTPQTVSPSASPSTAPSKKPQASSPSATVSPKPNPSPSRSPSPSSSQNPQSSRSPVAAVPHTGTAPLPQTGPSDDIFRGLMLATLVGISVAYVRSFRLHLQSSAQVD